MTGERPREFLARIDRLRVRFGDATVVDELSLHIRPGECLALVGESGSGKTITSRTLLGLVPAPGIVTADRLEVGGRDMRSAGERQWQRLRGSAIGLVGQDALVSLDPLRTIGNEVGETLKVQTRRQTNRLSREELNEAVRAELAHVAMPDPQQRARQYAHQLSGGLRQRALIAAATISRPALLVVDEPTTALDVTVQAQILELLGRLKREGTGLLLISHDLAVVSQIADRVMVMNEGKVVESDSVEAVLSSPRHPYTRSLLDATPNFHNKGKRLSTSPPLVLTQRRETDHERVVVSVREVSQSFVQPGGARLQAVDRISFDLHAGQTIGIVGESGSGKTTLGRIILGLQKPEAGQVLLDGQPWSGVPERARRGRRSMLQAVYQDPLSSFDPRSSVGAILREALALTGVTKAHRVERSVELAAQVGLAGELLGRNPLTLSGGQRQRVAIARALARNPQVLLCDEPVSALDVSIQAQVLDVFSDIREHLGLAMIFISHDLGVVHHVSDHVLVMHQGAIVERGTSDAVFSAPEHPYTQALLGALPAHNLTPQGVVPS